jgi:imidazolonepropionase-like amidohydrolase
MRRLRSQFLWLAFSSLFLSTFAGASDYIIRNVTVIDGTGKPAKPKMTVMVSDGKITVVLPTAESDKSGSQIRVIDGTGKYLIPGLWDVHVHLVDIGEVAIPILPTYGITSVRDMGGDVTFLNEVRSRIEDGTLIGPRVKFCGPMLEGKWEQKPGARTDHWVVATPQQAATTVAQLSDQGVDCIKMRSFANPETYFALAAAAESHHLPLVGHAPWGVDPIQSSNAGQKSYEHGYYPWPWSDLPAEKKKEIEDTFRKNSSLLVPTLIAWQTFRFDAETIAAVVQDVAAKSDPRLRQISPSLHKNWLSGLEDLKTQHPGTPGWNKAIDEEYEQIADMHDHGVGVMAGTDTGSTMVYPGAALHQELKLLVSKCRFTPMDALLTATIIPAKFFHLEDRLGTIQAGKLADMVLLSEDPLQDIANTQKIEGVMLNGQWFDRAALDGIISKTERAIHQAYETSGTRASVLPATASP